MPGMNGRLIITCAVTFVSHIRSWSERRSLQGISPRSFCMQSLAIVVPDHQVLIQYAITAFETSNIPKFDLKEINREWDAELTTNQWIKNEMWIKFKNFYIKKLLSVDVNDKKKTCSK